LFSALEVEGSQFTSDWHKYFVSGPRCQARPSLVCEILPRHSAPKTDLQNRLSCLSGQSQGRRAELANFPLSYGYPHQASCYDFSSIHIAGLHLAGLHHHRRAMYSLRLRPNLRWFSTPSAVIFPPLKENRVRRSWGLGHLDGVLIHRLVCRQWCDPSPAFAAPVARTPIFHLVQVLVYITRDF
jgi:hypothetical protein